MAVAKLEGARRPQAAGGLMSRYETRIRVDPDKDDAKFGH
jgi:hypothetical protein